MQLYIPKLGDLLRLTAPLTIVKAEVEAAGWHSTYVLWQIDRPGVPWDYMRAKNIVSAVLEQGTVLKFKRYFISSHAKENRINVSIWAHPNPLLTPRAQGGKGNTIVLELPVEVINRIEYEKVDP